MSDILSFTGKTHDETIEECVASMVGAEPTGAAVVIDGRAIPRLTMNRRKGEVDFILDGRFLFTFPDEHAHQAASFAANAMAIGGGWAFLGADEKLKRFAPQVAVLEAMIG